MKIDHIAVYVKDLEAVRAFYEKYFGAKANQRYYNPKTGLRTYFLAFDGGSRLEIMSRPDMARPARELNALGYIHLAFGMGSEKDVDYLTERLKNDGYTVVSGPRVTGDGCYESCVLDPERNQVEIVADNKKNNAEAE